MADKILVVIEQTRLHSVPMDREEWDGFLCFDQSGALAFQSGLGLELVLYTPSRRKGGQCTMDQ